jgi:hypothetical protein
MPGGDRTGPMGAGPRTGRARGYCSGYGYPGYMYPGPGLGLGRGFGRGFGRGIGFGRGRGWRRGGFGPYTGYPMMPAYGPGYWTEYPEYGPVKQTKEEEKQFLQDEVRFLEEEIAQINSRLQELQKQEKGKK